MINDKIRCYQCNRSSEDVVSLFNIEYKNARGNMKEMTKHTFQSQIDLDYDGKEVYRLLVWDIYDIEKYVKDEKILNWFIKMDESGGRAELDYDIYAYKEFNVSTGRYWLEEYLKNGGILLDSSKVQKIRVNFDYYLCPICEQLFYSESLYLNE